MKTLQWIVLLMVICIVSGGCPYESKVPIDTPSVKINTKLLGLWVDSQNENETYKVTQKDQFTYTIIKSEKESTDKEKYLAYASVINGTTFLNLWEIKDDTPSPSYSLFKLDIKSDDIIKISEVSENIDEVFTSGAALKEFIAANMKNSYFFGKEETNLLRYSNKHD